MKRSIVAIAFMSVLGQYSGSANAASSVNAYRYVTGTGTQAGTVTDKTTNLMWQQGTDGPHVWENAISVCEGKSLGGFVDWRLPNVKELISIADMTRVYPAIDAAYFPDTTALAYWSSTTVLANTSWRWSVNFDSGEPGISPLYSLSVRCVRGQ
jgi:hypothetical protein